MATRHALLNEFHSAGVCLCAFIQFPIGYNTYLILTKKKREKKQDSKVIKH
jgi:hypothetical protein